VLLQTGSGRFEDLLAAGLSLLVCDSWHFWTLVQANEYSVVVSGLLDALRKNAISGTGKLGPSS
jgi:hypothetical protein